MHEAAQQLVAVGKGKLLQQQFLTTTSGLKAETGTLRHFPYPTEYDPPEVSTKVVVQGGNVLQGDFKKAEPTNFETKELGFDLEIEPTVDDSSRYADLNLAATWTTHAGDQVWGQGIAEITQPVFQRCVLSAQALCEHDSWKLVALLRPAALVTGQEHRQPLAEQQRREHVPALLQPRLASVCRERRVDQWQRARRHDEPRASSRAPSNVVQCEAGCLLHGHAARVRAHRRD
jgi:hypothetical protein